MSYVGPLWDQIDDNTSGTSDVGPESTDTVIAAICDGMTTVMTSRL